MINEDNYLLALLVLMIKWWRQISEQIQYRMVNSIVKGSQGGTEKVIRGTSPKKQLFLYYFKLGFRNSRVRQLYNTSIPHFPEDCSMPLCFDRSTQSLNAHQ